MYHIVVRESRQDDIVPARAIIYSSIMSHCASAFYLFLFQEITLQLTVLLTAMMFIFVGLPLLWCVVTLPLVAFLVYLPTYAYHLYKASEVSGLRPRKQWVAEAYEPYYLSTDPRTLKYVVLEEYEAREQLVGADRMRKKIVGTVCVRDFHGPNNSVWLYGIAVDPGYHRKGVGRALANAALQWSRQNKVDSIELLTTDLQTEARLLFQNIGMEMRQMCHKQLLGPALTLAMFHQGLDLAQPPRAEGI